MIHWDPNPALIGPIRWYGLFFAAGFWGGYRLLCRLQQQLGGERQLCDRLIGWIIVGALIGARFMHVFAYDWAYYRQNLAEIWKIWEPGLASHGGALGAICAIWLFCRVKKLAFLRYLDLVAMVAMIPAGAIRIGNFFNQEILGSVSQLPWAVVFGHPVDGLSGVPRHPVQLYEALFYWALGAVLLLQWKKLRDRIGTGFVTGLVCCAVFGFRLLIECIKLEQAQQLSSSWGLMGQLLSIPYLVIGLILIVRSQTVSKSSMGV